MISRRNILLLAAILMMVVACRQTPTIDCVEPPADTHRENIINANRIIAHSEEQQIDAYVGRRGWQMKTLGSGVRLMVTHEGQGAPIEYEDTVAICYSIENLAGQRLYTQVEQTVVAGRLEPTRGLDAALRTLHHGDKARVILPSEQAYGVVGDADRIGSRMVLVYELEVL